MLVDPVLKAYGAINTETKENRYFKCPGWELYIFYSCNKRELYVNFLYNHSSKNFYKIKWKIPVNKNFFSRVKVWRFST